MHEEGNGARRRHALGAWLDDRSGLIGSATHFLFERLPAGTGWWFTTGSVLLVLLGTQVATGLVLMLYYVPSPDHAWDSVRFIIANVTFGRVLRNLHHYGASFIVVAAVVHMVRVFLFGAYKRPRELTWMTGVISLLIILAFALTGYLLPWDQRAYWATVVTLNIAKSAPVAGPMLADIMRGGSELGALTLTRWYAAHVALLPAVLAGLVGMHLMLMRRHRVSGPLAPVDGEEPQFYPDHAVRDMVVSGAVFAALFIMALLGSATLEPVADPTDASYTPRPEWYFLWLFQLLKYFPGPLEVVAAHVIPGLVVTLLLALPFLDRGPERRPWRRPVAMTAMLILLIGISTLTVLGLRDMPRDDVRARVWDAEALGGRLLASSDRCTTCHRENGAALPWQALHVTRDESWIRAHAGDPDTIAPGARNPTGDADEQHLRAVAAYARALRSGLAPPSRAGDEERVLALVGAHCLGCHQLDGKGHGDYFNLSIAGRDRDAEWLKAWITDPVAIEFDTDMPAFGKKLSEQDITALADYLAQRK